MMSRASYRPSKRTIHPGLGGYPSFVVGSVGQTYNVPSKLSLFGGDGSDTYTMNFSSDLPSTIVISDQGTADDAHYFWPRRERRHSGCRERIDFGRGSWGRW